MSELPPDRLCAHPSSKYYDEAALTRGIGVRFKGEEKHNVEEYCISEGWIRVPVGRALDRRGQPMTVKLVGQIEVWFKSDGAEPEPEA